MPDGQVASALLFLHDTRTAYYLIGANDPAFRKTGSGAFLMAEVIGHYRQAGQQFVDFVGVNSPNRGDFKTSFGARPVPYFEVTWKKP
jgi:lipid II:glycine glycyltransferase (peptidoglycan interpeptide bridge formation enzyme)